MHQHRGSHFFVMWQENVNYYFKYLYFLSSQTSLFVIEPYEYECCNWIMQSQIWFQSQILCNFYYLFQIFIISFSGNSLYWLLLNYLIIFSIIIAFQYYWWLYICDIVNQNIDNMWVFVWSVAWCIIIIIVVVLLEFLAMDEHFSKTVLKWSHIQETAV